jgi:hypothetical protein
VKHFGAFFGHSCHNQVVVYIKM